MWSITGLTATSSRQICFGGFSSDKDYEDTAAFFKVMPYLMLCTSSMTG